MELRNKLNIGEFVVLAETEPPKGVDISWMVSNALRVKGKVDAFLVPEMSSAVMRMSALGACMILQAKGLQTVMQVCCRDRNRIALQADLLAAYGCGITTVMAVEGQPVGFGDHPEAAAVDDVDLPQLLQALQKLKGGRDMAGIELSGAPDFLVGSTVNAGLEGDALERELRQMENQASAGVEFFITPPVFDVHALAAFTGRVDRKKTNLIPTVLLLKSVGMARYINRNFEHITVPEALIDRIQAAPDRVRECIRIASETVRQLEHEGLNGVLISTMGWENRLPEVLGGFGV